MKYIKLYTFKVTGNGARKWTGKFEVTCSAERKKVMIEAKDKATAIIDFLTQYPEFSNKIVCDLSE